MEKREQVYAELSAKYRAKWLLDAIRVTPEQHNAAIQAVKAELEAEKLEKAYYPEGLE